MIIFGLLLAIAVIVGIIFAVIRSVVIKLASAFILILAIVLVIAFNGNNIKEKTTPIQIDNTMIVLYQDGERYELPINSIYRVDASKTVDGKILISIATNTTVHKLNVSGFSYEWSLKNPLSKNLQGRFYSSVD